MAEKIPFILGIESSCDDTSAAVLQGDRLLSNIIASQAVHEKFGGVVPELASRAHQQNIIPVVNQAIVEAGITKDQLSAVCFTRGPGLLGSLLVGISFAKSLAIGLDIPIIEADHMQSHILAHFIQPKGEVKPVPRFPFLCLTVSGGHTQIVLVRDHFDMTVLGKTIDDAAGEAFDKVAKIMGLGYPGGPVVDRLAREGNPIAFKFARPRIDGLDYSFSGLKTSFLYFVRDQLKVNPQFMEEHKADLCASMQRTIVETLLVKLVKAAKETGIREVAVAGGVSANSALRAALLETAKKYRWNMYIPEFAFTTDNAAMIAISGYFKYLKGEFAGQDATPYARQHF